MRHACREDEPAEYLYQVVSGAVSTYRMLDDGRRQISVFYLPGDIFGVEAGDVHLASAEAISDTQILVAKRSAVMARAERERSVARQLWMLTVHELKRVQEHSLALIKLRSVWLASCLRWRAAVLPARRSICRCHARISPTIWA
jgi:CRP/FNR family transcriptional regulator, nitrogen fixation regulation protein